MRACDVIIILLRYLRNADSNVTVLGHGATLDESWTTLNL